MSRRRFLTGVGVAGTAAIAAGYGVSVWQHGDAPGGTRSATARAAKGVLGAGRDDRTLVVLELGGGNDGLSTVVPMTDPAYTALRPTLAIPNAIALDDTIGLSPSLPKLAARYHAGQVAIVEGLGYDDPNLSHFASLAYWWTGVPGEGSGTGWIGRYLDGTVGDDDPLAAISIGPVPSPALMGNASFATSIADATGLQPTVPAWVDTPDDLIAAWSKFAPAAPDPSTLLGGVQQAIRLTVKARRQLQQDLAAAPGAAATDPVTYAGRGQTGAGVAEALHLAAQLVASDHPPRVVYVSGPR